MELVSSSTPGRSPEPENDQAVVARAQRGDVRAFEQLYRGNAGRVFALCLRMTADRQKARELTQDVFVRAWERLSAFRGDSALASWLHRIAVNVVLMDARSERRRIARVSLAEDATPAAREGEEAREPPEGTARAIDVAQAIDLERAIAALPPGARRVFVLHDVEGYRHEEIAKMTGLAEGTLRAQLHRARHLLMEALER
jgi:RNA polymerase sigma-70 factor, ECF subfamily